MKVHSILGSTALLFMLAITSASCNPTGPHIKSASPGFWTLTPSNIMVTMLYGTNLALPTTTGYTFRDDIHVYFRYTYPDIREWVQIPPPNFAGWSSSQINVQLPATTQYVRPDLAIAEEGEIQFKVEVRTLGESNYFPFKVNGVPGSPHINATVPTTIPYTPSNTQVITLYGSHFACPDTTGYTFNTDIKIYFRYSEPEVTAWTRLSPPYFAGWSNSIIDIDLLGAGANNAYSLTSQGKVQFKVVSRCYGTSNVQTVDVQ